MSKTPTKKYTKIGSVNKGQYGQYISLGNPNSKNEKYKYNVDVRVTDSAGNQVLLVKNPKIAMKTPYAPEGKEAPAFLAFELVIAEELN